MLKILFSPIGIAILVSAVTGLIILIIKATPSKKDDQILKTVLEVAAEVERIIPDNSPLPAIHFVNKILVAMSQAGKLNLADKKTYEAAKAKAETLAVASKKVDTSPAEMAKL